MPWDFSFVKSIMGETPSPVNLQPVDPKYAPLQSPATNVPNKPFNLEEYSKDYIAPGPMSQVEAPVENKIPWADLGMAAAQGIGSALGSRPDPEPISPPRATGGQYFNMPKGNMSDGRLGGAPKGIMAQNYQL